MKNHDARRFQKIIHLQISEDTEIFSETNVPVGLIKTIKCNTTTCRRNYILIVNDHRMIQWKTKYKTPFLSLIHI